MHPSASRRLIHAATKGASGNATTGERQFAPVPDEVLWRNVGAGDTAAPDPRSSLPLGPPWGRQPCWSDAKCPMAFAAIGRRTECDDGRVVRDPKAWMRFFRASSQPRVPVLNRGSRWVKNPMTDRPCSRPGMIAAVAPLGRLNPYECGADEHGIGMMSSINLGERDEGA